QKKVEGNNFGIRKHVLKYDDVMNKQREVIYGQRRMVLEGENLRSQILEMVKSLVDTNVDFYTAQSKNVDEWDIEGLENYLENQFVEDKVREVERIILLQVVDRKWMDHIDAMDQLRQGIGLRAYGQQDPVMAYQKEGFDMFDEMTQSIWEDTVGFLYHVQNPE